MQALQAAASPVMAVMVEAKKRTELKRPLCKKFQIHKNNAVPKGTAFFVCFVIILIVNAETLPPSPPVTIAALSGLQNCEIQAESDRGPLSKALLRIVQLVVKLAIGALGRGPA